MSTEPRSTCPTCGNEFTGAMEFCPVCMLRQALSGGVDSGESSVSEDTLKPTIPDQPAQRFEHYELVKGEDGRPVELGRGAMGVTYKALDLDLHCALALKVFSERYFNDESARLRFLREARTAATLRHPNIASVFCSGRSGGNYFYAMELVNGVSLEHLIKRSGRLELKLSLEIATQVVAGLAAVHEKDLVHRDFKPSNILVSLKDGGTATAKIVDLGLAKATNEPFPEAAISTPGAFAGTPEYASPEQCDGLGVDIRSNLYSLGVILWEMLTGKAPFRGSRAEVIYQHQQAPLPVEQLKGVPQPVIILLEALLEKDPARRFQTPAELSKVMPMLKDAIDAGHRLMKTIRGSVSSTGDVQEEWHLADRVKIGAANLLRMIGKKRSYESTPELVMQRFEHYELVKNEGGQPIELGRGAMGITYKAFDVDLRIPVTLKVINEKYVVDKSARLRFLREARAAAKVRHTNVASIFHLGRSGQEYFYAMEFVEGETLENLSKRSGRLEQKLALEIAAQVAAGLAAVHEQNLVHRDIKPTNIMVSLKDGGLVTAKIIDLGLAKTVSETNSEAAISIPGAFAGTPEFASPEQFAGVGVDIRSDLYSLGVTLWKMLTGQVPFRGSPTEVMYQHQHAPLPLEQLEGVPQPVVTLLEVLLEKDPARRFQNPAELLKAMPTITDAIDLGRTITHQNLRNVPSSRASELASL